MGVYEKTAAFLHSAMDFSEVGLYSERLLFRLNPKMPFLPFTQKQYATTPMTRRTTTTTMTMTAVLLPPELPPVKGEMVLAGVGWCWAVMLTIVGQFLADRIDSRLCVVVVAK